MSKFEFRFKVHPDSRVSITIEAEHGEPIDKVVTRARDEFNRLHPDIVQDGIMYVREVTE